MSKWRGFSRRLAIAACAALLIAAVHGAGARAGANTELKPIPCGQQQWTYDSAAFDPLPGANAFSGRYAGGAFRIEIPNRWNGELVLYAHGFVPDGGPLSARVPISNPPIRQHLVEQGFAWAASSFRCNGYTPGIGLEDTLSLADQFAAFAAAPPRRTYLLGTSMGGHIALLGIHTHPSAFAGALAMCPAGPALFDYFAEIGAAAEAIAGVKLNDSNPGQSLVKLRRILGMPPNLSEKGKQLASVEIEMSGGARPFAVEGLASRFFQNAGVLSLGAGDSALERAATNANTTYRIDAVFGLTADQLNAAVRRKRADSSLRGSSSPYQEVLPFSGRIERPVLTMHGTGDLYVPIHLEQTLKRAVTAAKRQQMLVQRVYRLPGHCTFNLAEQVRSFDDLVAWVRDGVRPKGDNVDDLYDAGRQFTVPLRRGDPGTRRIAPTASSNQ